MHVFSLLLLFCVACSSTVEANSNDSSKSALSRKNASNPVSLTSKPVLPKKNTVVIAAVGDVLPHSPVRGSADRHNILDKEEKSQNHGGYDTLFERAKPAFLDADIGFANLETPIAPKNSRGTRQFVFNAPPDMLDAMKFLGVNIVSFSNNHVYDQNRDGFLETLEELEKKSLLAAGAGKNKKEAYQPRVFEFAGMKICFLGMTRLLNIDRQPKEETEAQIVFVPYGKDAKDPKESLLQAIPAAKKTCDFLLLSIHWGAEYFVRPAQEDITLAKELLEAGVDGILGHHPHVLQPIKRHQTEDGRETFIAYSMGNFISNQTKTYYKVRGKSGHTRDSMILRVKIRRDDTVKQGPKGVLDSIGFYPAYTDREITPKEDIHPKIIRGILIDREISEAKEELRLLESKETLSKEELGAKKAWKKRAAYLEKRRKEILKIVGEEFVKPLPLLPETQILSREKDSESQHTKIP